MYAPNLTHTLPISEEFGDGKIIQIDGVIDKEENREYPNISLYDPTGQEVLNVIVDPKASLLIISSPALYVIKIARELGRSLT